MIKEDTPGCVLTRSHLQALAHHAIAHSGAPLSFVLQTISNLALPEDADTALSDALPSSLPP